MVVFRGNIDVDHAPVLILQFFQIAIDLVLQTDGSVGNLQIVKLLEFHLRLVFDLYFDQHIAAFFPLHILDVREEQIVYIMFLGRHFEVIVHAVLKEVFFDAISIHAFHHGQGGFAFAETRYFGASCCFAKMLFPGFLYLRGGNVNGNLFSYGIDCIKIYLHFVSP